MKRTPKDESCPIRNEATTAPQRLPNPPVTVTMKQSVKKSKPMPELILRKGAAMTPAKPASQEPIPMTSRNIKGVFVPNASAISRSETIARTVIPKRVFIRMKARKPRIISEK